MIDYEKEKRSMRKRGQKHKNLGNIALLQTKKFRNNKMKKCYHRFDENRCNLLETDEKAYLCTPSGMVPVYCPMLKYYKRTKVNTKGKTFRK